MEIRASKHNEIERLSRKKYFIIILLLLVLFSCALAYGIGIKYKKYLFGEFKLWTINHGHGVMKQDYSLIRATMKAPLYYVQSLRSAEKIPRLVVDIKFKHFQNLQKKRDEAVAKGFLIKESDDFVPASIRLNGKTVKVKLRLKGDLTDHLQGNKWSFRIYVKGNDNIFGLRRFSIQHPCTRSFQAQPLFFETLRDKGVLTPRYFFVDVTVNGKDIGIMALEEHFSKELLESQKRYESVIIKFDESLFWDEWMAICQKGPIFDNYKNATIDAFGSTKIGKSEKLSKDYATAVGLLRGFVNGELSGSDVFDTELMGRFLAVSELFGARHGVSWNNMRFYFNPVTSRLEPIGFDSYRMLLSDELFSIISSEEPLAEKLLVDTGVFGAYKKTFYEVVNDVENGTLFRKMKKSEQSYLAILRREFLFLQEFPYSKVAAQVKKLQVLLKDGKIVAQVANKKQETIYPKYRYPTILHAYIIHDPKRAYLEMVNAISEEVEIKSIEWIAKDGSKNNPFVTLSDIKFPMLLPPTPAGALPLPQRIYFTSVPDGNDYSLQVNANIRGNQETYGINAKPYYAGLKQRPIPVSTVKEQLSQHPFLTADMSKNSLYVKPGKWQVNGSLVIPKGFSLTILPSTTLQFKSGEGLIAYGSLNFQGTEQGPILLEGISSTWQGLVVLEANEPSHWSYVTVNKTTGIKRLGWELTGGVTFYRSDVEMDNCTFRSNEAEDTVNIIRSKFKIKNIKIIDTLSDGFDSDFSEGTIEGGLFQDIGKAGGGDGLDLSGSKVMVNGSHFRNISDKGLSVGEQSEVKATNLIIEHVGTGAASKDSSELEISNSTINQAENAGLMAYIKKPAQFGPARIDAKAMKFIGTNVPAQAQKGSSITIDGVPVTTEEIDVDQLYKTIMKPARLK
jgi:hypothetical protein